MSYTMNTNGRNNKLRFQREPTCHRDLPDGRPDRMSETRVYKCMYLPGASQLRPFSICP
jgi:hypothetical protein